MNSNIHYHGGVGFLDVILIVNIILKLLGSINWSWGVVLWPLWIEIILCIILIIIHIIGDN
jgi:uncharacterized protein YqhQ